jgi:hypothetical protein
LAPRDRTQEILRSLARRPGSHDRVKADFRQLLAEEFGASIDEIEFEKRAPAIMGRLDALIGRTIFEAKTDLQKERGDVERRMPDYLADREREEGERFVGIASDGLRWEVYELDDGKLAKIKDTILDPEKPDAFLTWLDGVVALRASLPPNALTIRAELGGDSVAYRRAAQALADLWAKLKDEPAVALKRQLWAQLLKLVHGKEVQSDALWFQHTFLVVVAKAIAFAVLDLKEDDPAKLLSGEAFRAAGVKGAVESDFFDWVVAHPDGAALVRRLMNHIRRFRLHEVESDILKVLYESLIDRDERHGLGEYYTPDWLARKVVRHAVTAPLEQRVLDPACGSGAFLFHAVRFFLEEAESGDMQPEERARECCQLVRGLDIHPVAVIIARVTYLLALAPALGRRSREIDVPVFLGDSMQLSVDHVMSATTLVIRVPAAPDGTGATQLDFPELLCEIAEMFDALVELMREYSEAGRPRARFEAEAAEIVKAFYAEEYRRRGGNGARTFGEEEQAAIGDLGQTFETYDALRRAGRDTIWSYVARNLARPLSYSVRGGSAQVLVGNPPWVAFRHMSPDLQKRFKELANGERVYVGGKLATQNDLAALFTVRAAALYLRAAGRLAFVLPLAALTRGQFERLRSGSFENVKIAWDEAWTMDDGVAPLFPVPACVLFGRRRNVSKPTPDTVRAYAGTLPFRDASEEIADKRLTVTEGAPKPSEASFEGGSAYRAAFRQGAILVPRMLCLVERRPVGRLGSNLAAPAISSRRSAQEKEPWKSLHGIDGNVEVEFLHPVLLGESILPYRLFRPFEAVIPATVTGELLNAETAGSRGFAGLRDWMGKVEAVWNSDRASEISFTEQLDYYGKLRAQFPLRDIRIVYAKAGSLPAATVLRGSPTVIDHMLYWAAPASEDEALYLSAILNSEIARVRTENLQARGQFGARHFDKVIWSLPIPRYEPRSDLHRELATMASQAEKIASSVSLPETIQFQRARKIVRGALTDFGLSPGIDALVARLLGGS